MKNLYIILFTVAFLFTLSGCGTEERGKKDNGFSYEQPQQTKGEITSSSAVGDKPSERTDLTRKGMGPVKNLKLNPGIDREMAAKGKTLFYSMCAACHQVDQRMLGPKMQGITERRTPEWIMNIMLNPQEMLMKDPLAKELLAEFNNSIMVNQNLSEADARAVLEFLRTLN